MLFSIYSFFNRIYTNTINILYIYIYVYIYLYIYILLLFVYIYIYILFKKNISEYVYSIITHIRPASSKRWGRADPRVEPHTNELACGLSAVHFLISVNRSSKVVVSKYLCNPSHVHYLIKMLLWLKSRADSLEPKSRSKRPRRCQHVIPQFKMPL